MTAATGCYILTNRRRAAGLAPVARGHLSPPFPADRCRAVQLDRRAGDNGRVASDFPRRVTLAELVAMLSLVADLGMGRPMERVLRQTVVAMRLGAAAGMDPATRTSAYYTSLLTWVGCAVDTSEVAALFGDETELYAETHDEDLGGVSWRSSSRVIWAAGSRDSTASGWSGSSWPPRAGRCSG